MRFHSIFYFLYNVPDFGTTFFWSPPFPDSPCVPNSGTAFFRSLPVPAFSLRTGFRYNFLLITACSHILSAYRISVQLSSDRYLFPHFLCVPDSGTTFFRSLPISGSFLRTGFRYNFLLIADRSQILPAYRIPVQLSSDRRRSQILPDVPNFGTTFFRSLPISGSFLRTGFRYNFLLIAACSCILSAYRISVQLSSDRRRSQILPAYRIPVQFF